MDDETLKDWLRQNLVIQVKDQINTDPYDRTRTIVVGLGFVDSIGKVTTFSTSSFNLRARG